MSKTTTIGPVAERFTRIMNSRLALPISMAGKSHNLKVTSVTEDKEMLLSYRDPSKGTVRKTIYNLNASKEAVVQDPKWLKDWAKAIRLENEGDEAGAEELFQDLTRRAQITYSVITGGGNVQSSAPRHTFAQGEIVRCVFGAADTESVDKESGEVINRHSLIIESMSPVEAFTGSLKKGFNFDSAIVEEEEPEQELQKAAKPVAAKKAAVK